MRALDEVFERPPKSKFRVRFGLGPRERDYLQKKGMETVLLHGREFIDQRLAPADPVNDGKQTPMRGHPVFIAQHATATCCRSCLSKWHGITSGRPLTEAEKDHVLAALRRWLAADADKDGAAPSGTAPQKSGD